MYEDAEKEIAGIVKLIDGCPDTLKPKAFEILLQGYVDSVVRPPAAATAAPVPAATTASVPPAKHDDWSEAIPTESLPRVKQIAKRNKVLPEKIAALFDFSTDPFTLSTFHIPGSNNADRTRRVALAVAARSYISNGKWSADWREVKAVCTNQNCYDGNFAAALVKGKGGIFKNAKAGESIELSTEGVTEAEKLLADISMADDAASE